jgi:predicted GNAT superfamily acetyltransferase
MKNLEKIISLKGKKFLLRVETSSEAGDYEKYETMRNEIWGFPEDYLPGPRNLMCENFLHDGSALFLTAYAEAPGGSLSADPARFVGFSYGFVGLKDKKRGFHDPGNVQFYSQYTGVRESLREFGLGVALKEFQRESVLGLFGIDTITCTYDPLTGVNAWRNVHHFGMDVQEYRVSTYGEYGGLLNRLDVASDRFFMSWDLRQKPGERPASWEDKIEPESLIIGADILEVAGRNGRQRLELIRPVRLDLENDMLFFRIPRDFYLMLRETEVETPGIRKIPIDWRLETRRAFQTYFGRGYRVVDFFSTREEFKRNFYVLQKP